MKFKHVVASLSLAMFAAFGVAAGLSMKKEAKTVKADESYSGSIILQKNDDDAKWDGCKIVAWIFDDNEHGMWGDPVANTSNYYQEYSWTASFEATKVIMLRVKADWSSSWDNPWYQPYARTGDVTLASTDVLWMYGNAVEGGGWGTYELDAVVMGGASDKWSEATVDVALSGAKVNANNKLEAFGSVYLPADTYFKTVKLAHDPDPEKHIWCGAYTAHSSIASNFSNSEGEGNIHNIEAGTYEFYFDYDAMTTYITDPARAAADEFAQSFLSKTSGYCSDAVSSEVQAELKGEYDALAPIEGAQALFYGAEVKRGKGVDYESFASQALSRYVNMQEEKEYGDFLGLGAHNPEINPAIYGYLFANNTNNTAIIVITIAATSALAFTLLLVFKKKKQK